MKKNYVLSIFQKENQDNSEKTSISLPTEAPTVVGRGEDCDVVLPCPNRYLSRAHLKLQYSGPDRFLMENISSSNPCIVDDFTLLPGESSPLIPGQTVMLGRYLLQLDSQEAEKSIPDAVSTPSSLPVQNYHGYEVHIDEWLSPDSDSGETQPSPGSAPTPSYPDCATANSSDSLYTMLLGDNPSSTGFSSPIDQSQHTVQPETDSLQDYLDLLVSEHPHQ